MNPIIKQFNRRINLFIDDELLKKIDDNAQKRGWNRSMVIREFIKICLEKEKE